MAERKNFYLMEAANGMLVRVPADKLESWEKAQDEIRKNGFKPDPALSEEIVGALSEGRKE